MSECECECVCVCVCLAQRKKTRETLTISNCMLSLNIHLQYLSMKYSIFVFGLCVHVCTCVCARACMCLTILPLGQTGICRFQKNSSSIFMQVYAFINVAANCLRSNSQLVSVSTLVYHTDRERGGGKASERKRGRENYQKRIDRTKRGLELLQMALCLQQMKRRL